MYTRPTKIGVLVLEKPQIYTHLYEVAAWYTKIEVLPGEYDLIATFSPSGHNQPRNTHAYWVMVALPGTIVEEYTPSLWCGVPISGNGLKPEVVGNPMIYHGQVYGFSAAKAVVEKTLVWGGTLKVPLGDGITISEHPYESGDGRPMILYGLEVTL